MLPPEPSQITEDHGRLTGLLVFDSGHLSRALCLNSTIWPSCRGEMISAYAHCKGAGPYLCSGIAGVGGLTRKAVALAVGPEAPQLPQILPQTHLHLSGP